VATSAELAESKVGAAKPQPPCPLGVAQVRYSLSSWGPRENGGAIEMGPGFQSYLETREVEVTVLMPPPKVHPGVGGPLPCHVVLEPSLILAGTHL
jgi:hypothetical protein